MEEILKISVFERYFYSLVYSISFNFHDSFIARILTPRAPPDLAPGSYGQEHPSPCQIITAWNYWNFLQLILDFCGVGANPNLGAKTLRIRLMTGRLGIHASRAGSQKWHALSWSQYSHVKMPSSAESIFWPPNTCVPSSTL